MNKPVVFIVALVFHWNFSSAGITSDDTVRVNYLLQKGLAWHDEKPDSAIYYYQQVINHLSFQAGAVGHKPDKLEESYFIILIKALNKTGDIYYYEDEFSRAETYYRRSMEIAGAAGLRQYTGKAHFDLGYVRYVGSDYSGALDHFLKSREIYRETEDLKGIYHANLALGLAYRRLGNVAEADASFSAGLQAAVRLNDSLKIADIGLDRGILLCEQGNMEEGMALFERALNYYEKTGNDLAVSSALLNIGVVMKLMGEYDLALDYIARSTAMEEIRQQKSDLVARYYNMADLYMDMGAYDRALDYTIKLETVAGEIGSRPFITESNFLKGKYHYLTGDYQLAANCFDKAAEHILITNDRSLAANVSLWTAKTRMQRREVSAALEQARNAYALASEMGLLPVMKDAGLILAEGSEQQGMQAEALKWLRLSMQAADSLDRVSREHEIRRIEARYNFEKKEKENELLRNRASLQEQKIRNRTIATVASIAGVLMSLVIISLLVKRSRDAHKMHQQQQMLNLQHLEALERELDGKNRELTSKTMFLNQKSDMINRLIRRLQEIRDNSENSSDEIVSLVNELRADAPQSSWKEFEVQFLQVHPGFYQRLYERHPELTSYEQRICAFLRMNLNTKEISAITGRSAKSIEVTRSRIRQKLNLKRDDNLSSFLAAV